ncbi:hypothetical protein G4D82_00550 [Flavobacterium sp. CYK-4]|uniref:hypothetical protein n=1 Tax=Flavobacterium lotistagni TaxID=2709660 RepID=UPI001408EB54|nr:hypothetical protein [Flavobacterium lotistagni]NHM05698.1 hypothetical protein [Flavobacterium lotistagni]
MIKKFLLVLIVIATTSFRSLETEVFICGKTGAKKYHLEESCRGLNACKHEVIKVTKSKAQSYGLTLCGWED